MNFDKNPNIDGLPEKLLPKLVDQLSLAIENCQFKVVNVFVRSKQVFPQEFFNQIDLDGRVAVHPLVLSYLRGDDISSKSESEINYVVETSGRNALHHLIATSINIDTLYKTFHPNINFLVDMGCWIRLFNAWIIWSRINCLFYSW